MIQRILKFPFTKEKPDTLKFNFKNGLSVILSFNQPHYNDDSHTLIEDVQTLFCNGYASVTCVVLREHNDLTVENLTETLFPNLPACVSSSEELTDLLIKVSAVRNSDRKD